ncbi:protein PLASTID MOVEMENT IMPAIRED 1-like [Curcuma longa]|uniref:protein PLASTID MOVEMENT IMPAIRED 1-like n=1 Tax=Curcuma longa TaxID=136217 RepID=UPI003D9ECBEE
MADHDAEILRELETLSKSLSKSRASRRAASLVLPRSSNTGSAAGGARLVGESSRYELGSQSSRRQSLSFPWSLRGRKTPHGEDAGGRVPEKSAEQTEDSGEKRRGIWNWKPVRGLARLAMRRVACLFSVEVVAVRRLPPSADGLRLSVSVRKKETKEGSLQTMPSRVAQGRAEFEETLFLRSHLYCSGGASTGKPLRFEPRLFLISAIAVDEPHLDLGTNAVDLSSLVRESIRKNLEGHRVRQWNVAFPLSGKAAGAEMAVKLAFQIMDDGGISIYKQAVHSPKSNSSIARDVEASKQVLIFDQEQDFDLPDYDVIDKGVEIVASENGSERASSVSSEVVKEVVHDRAQLHLIAREIKELEMLIMADAPETRKMTQQPKPQRLDTEEESVTREFFHLLEIGDSKKEIKNGEHNPADLSPIDRLIPELGKNLGCIVQTSDGGYLASMNPFNAPVSRTDTPKLAMQISRELIIGDEELAAGFEVFQRLALLGPEELCSKLLSLTAMEDLAGKTAEQMAFEGIAAAIISGRSKEGASSSAARSIAAVKKMAAAMRKGRKGRASSEEAVTLDEVLFVALQKMEAMAVDALKIQADMSDEEAPMEAPPSGNPLNLGVKHEDWCTNCSRATIAVVIQLRAPLRGYEAVGAPMIAMVQAAAADQLGQAEEEERSFKLESVHVGGIKLGSNSKGTAWDGEKQRLTAMQWLVENGVGKAGGGGRRTRKQAKRSQDFMWSVSSTGAWLKHVRNPNLITVSL